MPREGLLNLLAIEKPQDSQKQRIQIQAEKGGLQQATRCSQELTSLFPLPGTIDREVTSISTLEIQNEKLFLTLRITRELLEEETLKQLTLLTPPSAPGEIGTRR